MRNSIIRCVKAKRKKGRNEGTKEIISHQLEAAKLVLRAAMTDLVAVEDFAYRVEEKNPSQSNQVPFFFLFSLENNDEKKKVTTYPKEPKGLGGC